MDARAALDGLEGYVKECFAWRGLPDETGDPAHAERALAVLRALVAWREAEQAYFGAQSQDTFDVLLVKKYAAHEARKALLAAEAAE